MNSSHLAAAASPYACDYATWLETLNKTTKHLHVAYQLFFRERAFSSLNKLYTHRERFSQLLLRVQLSDS